MNNPLRINKITTKLINELREICHKKCISFYVWNRTLDYEKSHIDLASEDAPSQLQAAIDKIKEM